MNLVGRLPSNIEALIDDWLAVRMSSCDAAAVFDLRNSLIEFLFFLYRCVFTYRCFEQLSALSKRLENLEAGRQEVTKRGSL